MSLQSKSESHFDIEFQVNRSTVTFEMQMILRSYNQIHFQSNIQVKNKKSRIEIIMRLKINLIDEKGIHF